MTKVESMVQEQLKRDLKQRESGNTAVEIISLPVTMFNMVLVRRRNTAIKEAVKSGVRND